MQRGRLNLPMVKDTFFSPEGIQAIQVIINNNVSKFLGSEELQRIMLKDLHLEKTFSGSTCDLHYVITLTLRYFFKETLQVPASDLQKGLYYIYTALQIYECFRSMGGSYGKPLKMQDFLKFADQLLMFGLITSEPKKLFHNFIPPQPVNQDQQDVSEAELVVNFEKFLNYLLNQQFSENFKDIVFPFTSLAAISSNFTQFSESSVQNLTLSIELDEKAKISYLQFERFVRDDCQMLKYVGTSYPILRPALQLAFMKNQVENQDFVLCKLEKLQSLMMHTYIYSKALNVLANGRIFKSTISEAQFARIYENIVNIPNQASAEKATEAFDDITQDTDLSYSTFMDLLFGRLVVSSGRAIIISRFSEEVEESEALKVKKLLSELKGMIIKDLNMNQPRPRMLGGLRQNRSSLLLFQDKFEAQKTVNINVFRELISAKMLRYKDELKFAELFHLVQRSFSKFEINGVITQSTLHRVLTLFYCYLQVVLQFYYKPKRWDRCATLSEFRLTCALFEQYDINIDASVAFKMIDRIKYGRVRIERILQFVDSVLVKHKWFVPKAQIKPDDTRNFYCAPIEQLRFLIQFDSKACLQTINYATLADTRLISIAKFSDIVQRNARLPTQIFSMISQNYCETRQFKNFIPKDHWKDLLFFYFANLSVYWFQQFSQFGIWQLQKLVAIILHYQGVDYELNEKIEEILQDQSQYQAISTQSINNVLSKIDIKYKNYIDKQDLPEEIILEFCKKMQSRSISPVKGITLLTTQRSISNNRTISQNCNNNSIQTPITVFARSLSAKQAQISHKYNKRENFQMSTELVFHPKIRQQYAEKIYVDK